MRDKMNRTRNKLLAISTQLKQSRSYIEESKQYVSKIVSQCEYVCKDGMEQFARACGKREKDMMEVLNKLSSRLHDTKDLIEAKKYISELKIELEMLQKHNTQLKSLITSSQESSRSAIGDLASELSKSRSETDYHRSQYELLKDQFEGYKKTIESTIDQLQEYIQQIYTTTQQEKISICNEMKDKWRLHTNTLMREVQLKIDQMLTNNKQ